MNALPPVDIPAEARRRLTALLHRPTEEAPRWIERLRELRRLESWPTFRWSLRLLANLDRPDREAERLIESVAEHRLVLTGRLERDPGLIVAALDYLSHRAGLLTDPVVMEAATLSELERSAAVDELTRALNRAAFDRGLARELRRSQRYALPFSLVLLDLDHFKAINDDYGHPYGDRVLARVAELLQGAVRECDRVFRFGGEEFVLLLPETERVGAMVVAQRARRKVKQTFDDEEFAGQRIGLTVSAGISTYPHDGNEAPVLLEAADRALYHAKEEGRDRVVAYHAERRRDVRFPFNMASRVTLRGPDDTDPLYADPLDLSRGGALVAVEDGRRLDGEVEVEFATEHCFGSVSDSSLSIRGQVVRVEPDASLDRVAIRFDEPLPLRVLSEHALFLDAGIPVGDSH